MWSTLSSAFFESQGAPKGHEDADHDVWSRRDGQASRLLVARCLHEEDDVEGGRLELRQPVGDHIAALPRVEPEAFQGTIEKNAFRMKGGARRCAKLVWSCAAEYEGERHEARRK